MSIDETQTEQLTNQCLNYKVDENNKSVIDKNKNEWSFGIDPWKNITIKPTFKNLKEEVLKNSFSAICGDKWNDILSKSRRILNYRNGCMKRVRFSNILRGNGVSLKNIVAIKLYTDDDHLQREFSKCFISKYQKDENYEERLSQFYHWRKELMNAFAALSKIKYFTCFKKNNNENGDEDEDELLYHGVTFQSMEKINQTSTYFGPLSTTTDINIARDFAGKNGMIMVIKPNRNNSMYKTINISLISDFEQECEVLLFNHNINIENIIYSNNYDDNYSYYKQLYITKKIKKRKQKLLSETDIVNSLKNNITNATKKNDNDYVHIVGNDEKKEENELNLLLNNKNGIHLYLLCAIYQFALEFNKQYQSQHEINKILKQFSRISIAKPLYQEFLIYQHIPSHKVNNVLSQYIKVSS